MLLEGPFCCVPTAFAWSFVSWDNVRMFSWDALLAVSLIADILRLFH